MGIESVERDLNAIMIGQAKGNVPVLAILMLKIIDYIKEIKEELEKSKVKE